MLKSTYKPPVGPAPLASGWTEHKAPDGRSYYYNDAHKQSTYIRPIDSIQPRVPSSHETLERPSVPPHSIYNTNGGIPFLGHHDYNRSDLSDHNNRQDNDWRNRDSQRRPLPKDRPKRKQQIPGCPPWLLVHTKLGRRFVHNSESGESFWKFPPDVMRAVVEYDRLEREKRNTTVAEDEEQAIAQAEITAVEDKAPTASPIPPSSIPEQIPRLVDSDGEEYEEVEVTDDEEDDHQTEGQKTGEGDASQPVEFNEDDIAYQLAAMGEDYGLDPGEYGNDDVEELEEGAEGLGLTAEDAKALFKDMLSDFQINPYNTWDKIIGDGHIIEDDRYTVLTTMRSRKEVWDEWSRDAIQRTKDEREKEEKKDPRIPYFAFLQSHATPKLYWPEFRRKYRKEPEIHNTKLSDKDREKWYREYINGIKLPESTLKADLVALLKSKPTHALNQSSTIHTLPPSILTDMRYISLRSTIRSPIIEAHLSTLPPAPTNEVSENSGSQAKLERERRKKALADRQAQVQEEKRRQRGALQHSKGMLQEGEAELQRAMKVGKEGLLGHME